MSQSAIADPIAEFVKERAFRMLIGGDLVGAADDQTAEPVNSSTGEPVSEVPEGTTEDIGRAVKAAKKAQPEWEAIGVIGLKEVFTECERLPERD